MIAPLSLIVSAFAPSEDVRRALTPQLRADVGETELVLIDLGGGRNRLGGSRSRRCTGSSATHAPDLDEPAVLRAFFAADPVAEPRRPAARLSRPVATAGCSRALSEMAFAGRCGVTLNLDLIGYDRLAHDVEATSGVRS